MSVLRLRAEQRNGRTVLTDCGFTAPLKIAKPFYQTGRTDILMMAASAGMLEGDHYEISMEVGAEATLKYSEQSYTKVFQAEALGARHNTEIWVAPSGTLLYLPQPVIPYAGSIYSGSTAVHLSRESRFAMCEIVACGRKAMQEQFAFQSYLTNTEIWIDNRLIFLDRTRLIPKDMDLSGPGYYEGFSHQGFLFLYGLNDFLLPEYSDIDAARTAAVAGTVVRMLGHNADSMYHFAEAIVSASCRLFLR